MRIIVVSDSHGRRGALFDAISAQPTARACIFLGDGERDLDDIGCCFPTLDIYAVAGNCDMASQNPALRLLELGGKRIYVTHGHNQFVKYGLQNLIDAAKSSGADVAIFGHTHQPLTQYIDGLYLLNPGSVGGVHTHKSTYGIIDITPAGIMTNIVEL